MPPRIVIWPNTPEEAESFLAQRSESRSESGSGSEFHLAGQHLQETHGNWSKGIDDLRIVHGQFEKIKDKITRREKEMIEDLTDGGIMTYLKGVRRKGQQRQSDRDDQIAIVEKLVQNAPEFDDVVLTYRGYQEIHRGKQALVNMSEEQRAKFLEIVAAKKYPKGRIITDLGGGSSASSSLDPAVAARFATTNFDKEGAGGTQQAGIIFEIETRKGLFIGPLAKTDHVSPHTGKTIDLRHQHEVLHSTKSQYEVVGQKKRKVFVREPTGEFRVDENGDRVQVEQIVVQLRQVK